MRTKGKLMELRDKYGLWGPFERFVDGGYPFLIIMVVIPVWLFGLWWVWLPIQILGDIEEALLIHGDER